MKEGPKNLDFAKKQNNNDTDHNDTDHKFLRPSASAGDVRTHEMWILLKRLSRIQRATQGLAALLHGQQDPQAFPDTTRRPLRAEVRKGLKN